MRKRYSPLRIVIADDHPIFRDGFKLLLKNQDELELVGEAENGRDLLNLVSAEHPDIAIVDIVMPVMDGIEACRQLSRIHPEVKVIALSMFNDDHMLVDMLEAGARGYLLKNTNKQEFMRAALDVWAGRNYYCASTSARVARLIADSKIVPNRKKIVRKFTERELQIVKLICEQCSNKEIAVRLGLSSRTVESHRERILEKTDSRNSVGVAIYAMKNKLYP